MKLKESKAEKKIDVIWNKEFDLFECSATIHQSIKQKFGFGVSDNWYFYPEEALFLQKKNKIMLSCIENQNSVESIEEVMKASYEQNENQIYCNFESYLLYDFMKIHGAHLVRYYHPLKLMEIMQEKKVEPKKQKSFEKQKVLMTNLAVFNCYETNEEFNRKNISFYIILLRENQSLLSIELISLLNELQEEKPIKLSIIFEKEVILYDFNDLL